MTMTIMKTTDRIILILLCSVLLLLPFVTCRKEDEGYRIRGSSSSSFIQDEQQRIVGGTQASKGEYPWLVELYNRRDPTDYFPVCQGSLITPQIVLTAAHCIDSTESATMGNYHYLNDSTNQIERFTILKKVKHPQYLNFDYDFGLILLDRPHPRPTLAGISYSPEIPGTLQIMGFGQTAFDGTQPYVLQEATVQRTPNDVCRENYRAAGYSITESMFCARAPGIDACQGDSGGPIMRSNTNIQIGVVSWGVNCALPQFPGVYARVHVAYPWINEVVCSDSWTASACTSSAGNNDRMVMDMVDEEGRAVRRADKCTDVQGDFMGLGKRGKRRKCQWVAGRVEARCKWYGDLYCPATCQIERCQ